MWAALATQSLSHSCFLAHAHPPGHLDSSMASIFAHHLPDYHRHDSLTTVAVILSYIAPLLACRRQVLRSYSVTPTHRLYHQVPTVQMANPAPIPVRERVNDVCLAADPGLVSLGGHARFLSVIPPQFRPRSALIIGRCTTVDSGR